MSSVLILETLPHLFLSTEAKDDRRITYFCSEKTGKLLYVMSREQYTPQLDESFH